VQAAVAVLKKVEGELLTDHIAHRVEHTIRSGDKHAQCEKIAELVATLERTRG
jgi:CsoR family transcriptional regulator, copper-sensing transcriptional repressor